MDVLLMEHVGLLKVAGNNRFHPIDVSFRTFGMNPVSTKASDLARFPVLRLY